MKKKTKTSCSAIFIALFCLIALNQSSSLLLVSVGILAVGQGLQMDLGTSDLSDLKLILSKHTIKREIKSVEKDG